MSAKRKRPVKRAADQRSLDDFFSVRHAVLPETDSEVESEEQSGPESAGPSARSRPPPASPMEASASSQEATGASSQEEAYGDDSSDEEWSPTRSYTCPQTGGKTIYSYYLVQIGRVQIHLISVL